MDYAADYTARLKVHYTSMGQPHSAVWRIAESGIGASIANSVGVAFKATIHNTDVVSRYEVAAEGSNVFLPISTSGSSIGAGGRSGTLPAVTGLALATQLTWSGRTVAGGKWKFVVFTSLYPEYDDFKVNTDEMDAADISFRTAMLTAGTMAELVGNDGSPVGQIYTRMTVAINDHYLALYRRTRSG